MSLSHCFAWLQPHSLKAIAALSPAPLPIRPTRGAIFETVTTPTGNYTIASLPVGLYDLTIESAGFSKKTQQGIPR